MKQILTFASLFIMVCCTSQTEKQSNKEKQTQMSSNDKLQKATFGGGCFWCVEAVFDQLQGVESTVSGYAGGHTVNPTYKEVCSGTTGHAEVVQIVFDPSVISYDELLDVFWTVHDPTQLNRQGNDVGEQYRSIILYENEEQKLIAERSIKEYEASDMYDGSFTTQLVPLNQFYSAEAYHQQYYENNAHSNPYCSLVIAPKIDKFYKKFHDKLKPEYR
jgi:peptide-methionine (S)-S-oxide reductase